MSITTRRASGKLPTPKYDLADVDIDEDGPSADTPYNAGGETGVIDFSDDSSGERQRPSPKIRKILSKKKPKPKKAAKTPSLRGHRGKLANLLKMPMDIFVEITHHLKPLDLLRLSRVSKFLRNVLLSPSSKPMWRAARQNLPYFPDCPPDLSEPAYAHLVFESMCTMCGKTPCLKLELLMRFRLCKTCYKENIWALPDYPRLPEHDVTDLLPTTINNQIKYRFHQAYYFKPCITKMSNAYHALKTDEEKKKFKEEKAVLLEELRDHAVLFGEWNSSQVQEKSELNRQQLAHRRSDIIARMANFGYTEADVPTLRLGSEYREFENMVKKSTARLTDRTWRTLEPRMLAVFEVSRKARLERERAVRERQRVIELQEFYNAFREKQPAHTRAYFPKSFPFLTLATPRKLIANNTEPVTGAVWAENLEAITTELNEWKVEVRKRLAVLLKPKPKEEPIASTSDAAKAEKAVSETENDDAQNLATLSLATSLFDCKGHCRKLCAYPQVFEHYVMPMPDYAFGLAEPYQDFNDNNQPQALRFLARYEGAWYPSMEYQSLSGEFAKAALKALELDEDTTIEQVMELGEMLVCICCPERDRKLFQWPTLIEHLVQREAYVYSTLANKHTPSTPNLVKLLTEEEADQLDVYDPGMDYLGGYDGYYSDEGDLYDGYDEDEDEDVYGGVAAMIFGIIGGHHDPYDDY